MCTNLTILSGSSEYCITARTMDFGTQFKTRVCLVPRSQSFPSDKPDVNPMTWKTKYGFVGMAMGSEELLNQTVYYTDGMNAMGLSAACLWLPGTEYAAPTTSGRKNLFSLDFVGWVLGCFESVKEVRLALSSVNIINVDPMKHPMRLPMHWMMSDAYGEHLVVELIDGVITTYPNSTYKDVPPVMTNAPTFDWQIINQTNYVDLSLTNNTKKFWGQEINGSGMYGMPGDATPPSRFVRANMLRQSTFQPGDTQKAVALALQVLQNMVVPYGTVLTDGGEKEADFTQWSVVRDHKERVFYFLTAFNNNLFSIDLKVINFGAPKTTSIPAVQSVWVTDLTKALESGPVSATAPVSAMEPAEETPA